MLKLYCRGLKSLNLYKNMNAKDIAGQERELIIARLETLSPEMCFSSGNSATMTRDELISHIKENDTVGKEFVKIQLEFLRAFKSGNLMKELTAD